MVNYPKGSAENDIMRIVSRRPAILKNEAFEALKYKREASQIALDHLIKVGHIHESGDSEPLMRLYLTMKAQVEIEKGRMFSPNEVSEIS